MKVINNPTNFDIVIGIEGYDYYLPKYKEVLVEEKIADFLTERYPFLDTKEPSKHHGPAPVPRVERKKTETKIVRTHEQQNTDMRISKKADVNATNMEGIGTGTDVDGVEWYGPGAEEDTGVRTSGTFR